MSTKSSVFSGIPEARGQPQPDYYTLESFFSTLGKYAGLDSWNQTENVPNNSDNRPIARWATVTKGDYPWDNNPSWVGKTPSKDDSNAAYEKTGTTAEDYAGDLLIDGEYKAYYGKNNDSAAADLPATLKYGATWVSDDSYDDVSVTLAKYNLPTKVLQLNQTNITAGRWEQPTQNNKTSSRMFWLNNGSGSNLKLNPLLALAEYNASATAGYEATYDAATDYPEDPVTELLAVDEGDSLGNVSRVQFASPFVSSVEGIAAVADVNGFVDDYPVTTVSDDRMTMAGESIKMEVGAVTDGTTAQSFTLFYLPEKSPVVKVGNLGQQRTIS